MEKGKEDKIRRERKTIRRMNLKSNAVNNYGIIGEKEGMKEKK